MKLVVFIVSYLFVTTGFGAEEMSSVQPFSSKEALIKKIHDFGFGNVIEVKKGVLNLTVHSVSKEASGVQGIKVSYDERVPEFDYVLTQALLRTIYARAYKAYDSMICYLVEQPIVGADQSCLIFPYDIDEVIEAIAK